MKHAGASFLLFALLSLVLGGCEEKNQYDPPPPPTVTVSPPVQKEVIEYLAFTGRTEAVQTVEIRARVKGFLEEIKFEEGDIVEARQPLFIIEQAEYEQAVRSAKASVAAANAQLSLGEATLERMKQAAKTNAVSQLGVLEAQAKRDVAVAGVDLAGAALDTAELNLEYTTIVAPIGGRIGRRLVHKGNLVGAREDTQLTTIVKYDPMEVVFDMSERELLALVARQRAQKNAPSKPDLQKLRATPLELGLANEKGYPHAGNIHYVDQGVDAATGTLLLRGRFPNPHPYTLYPGLFVRIRIPFPVAKESLLVPERALSSDQGGWYVLVVDSENVVQHRRIERGQKVDDLIVVTSGLEPQDSVVVNGILRARPGAKVTPQPQGESPPPAAAAPPAATGSSEG